MWFQEAPRLGCCFPPDTVEVSQNFVDEIEQGGSAVLQTLRHSEYESDQAHCLAQPLVVAYPVEVLGSLQDSVEVDRVAA